MNKPTKAYLVEESHAGFGFRVTPCIVLAHDGKLAHVAHLNVAASRITGAEKAWVPTLAREMPVRVADLASTRTKALAKIALRLRDLDEALAAHFALLQAAPGAGAPASMPAVKIGPPPPAPRPTAGGPRRPREPWYRQR